jgi:hypothetical protein
LAQLEARLAKDYIQGDDNDADGYESNTPESENMGDAEAGKATSWETKVASVGRRRILMQQKMCR